MTLPFPKDEKVETLIRNDLIFKKALNPLWRCVKVIVALRKRSFYLSFLSCNVVRSKYEKLFLSVFVDSGSKKMRARYTFEISGQFSSQAVS